MVVQALLESTSAPVLALAPATLDRIVVWSVLVLVLCLIAWREYTLPDVSPPLQVALAEAADTDDVGVHRETRTEVGQ
jgi:hypothetical protein